MAAAMEPAAGRPEAAEFWEDVASVPGGERIATCVRCDTCTSTCPVEALDPSFSLRRTIARVKAGLRETVLLDDTIWACTRCFACDASCPKDARPGEILGALRHLSLRAGADGRGPRYTLAFVKSVRDYGRVRRKAPSSRAPRLRSVTEVRRIIAAAEEIP